MTNLDFAGPYDVLAKMPGADIRVLWKSADLVRTDTGLDVRANTALADCPPLDMIFAPGGPGQIDLMYDDEVLDFLAERGRTGWTTSVCTGALLLGAAGLLRGKRAATHWLSMDQLSLFGAIPVEERVVVDGQTVTGGGVTAGIDFGLSLLAILAGEEAAQRTQLGLEYNPRPPFDAGSPHTAPAAVVADIRERAAPMLERRRIASLEAVARRLGSEA